MTSDIPTAESLKLTSHVDTNNNVPQPPPSRATETMLKRDEWMLMPPSAVSAPASEPGPSNRRVEVVDESLTEDYGEPPANVRGMGGGVDFFSSLGTEREKKPKEGRPDPEKVSFLTQIPCRIFVFDTSTAQI